MATPGYTGTDRHRPLKYKTPEELKAVCDEYFEWCDNRTKKVWDNKEEKELLVSDPAPYTMSGLANALEISRRALLDYADRDEFLPTIKWARGKVEEDVETRLMEKQATGAIFNLKNNFGWKDETSTDLTSKGERILDAGAVLKKIYGSGGTTGTDEVPTDS
jgi:hypothetical protein